MVNAVFIFLGLSLDSFVVMMKKGASLRKLSMQDKLQYSLFYAAINAGMFLAGCLLSMTFDDYLPSVKAQILAAAVLINIIGVIMAVKSFLAEKFEERLDREFNLKSLARLAAVTSISSLIIGVGLSLIGISTVQALGLAAAISFLAVFAGLNIGENLGVGYQRVIGFFGGVVLIVFSLALLIRYGLR